MAQSNPSDSDGTLAAMGNSWPEQLSASRDEVARLSDELAQTLRDVSELHAELVRQRDLAATLLSALASDCGSAGVNVKRIQAESPKTQSGLDSQAMRLAIAQELYDRLARNVEQSRPLAAKLAALDYADSHPANRR